MLQRLPIVSRIMNVFNLKKPLKNDKKKSIVHRIINTFIPLERESDLLVLDIFQKKIDTLNNSIISSSNTNHPINDIAISARNIIRSEINHNDNTVHIVQKLNSYLLQIFSKYDYQFKLPKEGTESIPAALSVDNQIKSEDDIKIEFETAIKVYHTYQYFQRFLKSCTDQEILSNEVSIHQIIDILDVFLRGNADERIVYHMKLFEKERFNQERLQEAFYSLYESEIQTCTSLILMNPNLHKHHLKKIPIYGKTYLLDKAELNMKLRCVLAWSDPKYSGFQPIAKEFTMPTLTLFESRRQFYPEGTNIASQFIKDYIGTRQEYYNNIDEFHSNLKKGIAFFIVTSILDIYLCII